MTMESLEVRLRSLERRNARLKIVVLLAAMFTIAVNLISLSENLWAVPSRPEIQDIVRAQRIEIVDTDGKLLAVLGKLTDRHKQTSTGLALVSNDKHVLQLAMRSRDDGSLSFAEFAIINPEDVNERELFSAGVSRMSHGVGLVPKLAFYDREAKFITMLDPSGLSVSVKMQDLSYAGAISLRANEDHSASLSLGGLFKPFNLRAIAESDKPRLELEKDGQIKTFGFGP